jgi:nitrogen regulatory protein PII
MKLVQAYIQPFMLPKVLRELHDIHVRGMTMLEVKGFGREKDESYPHQASDFAVDFTPKVRLELLCHDEEVDEIVSALSRSAHTGRGGDGKVFVTEIGRIRSIRTGEEAEKAI